MKESVMAGKRNIRRVARDFLRRTRVGRAAAHWIYDIMYSEFKKTHTLPGFLGIGAQKAGTTSLYNYLRLHPEIFLPAGVKELNFFGEIEFTHSLGWYKSFFPSEAEVTNRLAEGKPFVCGEVSPEYMFAPYIPAMAHRVLPHAKLLIVVRDPIKRALSHYRMNHDFFKRGGMPFVPKTFEEAIALESQLRPRLEAAFEHARFLHRHDPLRMHTYLLRSKYDEQIGYWLRYYPLSQMYIFSTEEMARAPQRVMSEIFAFLGVDDYTYPSDDLEKRYNTAAKRDMPASAQLSQTLHEQLQRLFEPHNERLYALLGRRFDW